MFKKVLVCTDLSQASNALVGCVGDLKNIGVEEVILTHISYIIALPKLNSNVLQDEALFPENPTLKEQKVIFEEAGIKTSLETTTGIPASKINQLAEKHDVSAIVVGSHGKGILERATLGSVSSEVISLSKKPVFLVRLNIDKSSDKVALACKNSFNHVLYLTDFSETAVKALGYLENIVEETKCSVTVTHISEFEKIKKYLMESSKEIPENLFKSVEPNWNQEIKAKLEIVKSKLEKAGSQKVQIQILSGRPIEEVMEMIQQNKKYSLVVMGSQGKGFVKEFFLGSLSLQLSRYSPIPILLIPAKYKG